MKDFFYKIKDRLAGLFIGRQGMDELSKAMFWGGLVLFFSAVLFVLIGIPGLAGLVEWFGIFTVILAFVRAFSRNLGRRESENYMYLSYRAKKRGELQAAKERRRQSKEYKFFKCPGCHKWLRVPRGKGKIHISCKCGYTLYRKT